MAVPTIVFNNSTGSDTLSSGAGPNDGTTSGTAQNGSDASTDSGGTVVTVPNADLTDVATDGSHAIWLGSSEGWGKITAKASSGTASANVTVSTAFTGSLTGQTYAIGGKRSSVDTAITQGLFGSRFEAGWSADIEYTGSTYTITQEWDCRSANAGNKTDGANRIFSSSSSRPKVLRASTSNGDFLIRFDQDNNDWQVSHIEFEMTGTTGTVTLMHLSRPSRFLIHDCSFTMSGAATLMGVVATGNAPDNVKVINCTFDGCDTGYEKDNTGASKGGHAVIGCKFIDCGIAIEIGDVQDCLLMNNLIYGSGTQGIKVLDGDAMMIIGNTITGMSDDGIELESGEIKQLLIFGNIITGNSGYGINRLGADGRDIAWQVDYNCFGTGSGAGGANSSGSTNNLSTGDNNIDQDPLFTNSGSDDYTLQASSPCLEAGFPEAIGEI